MPEYTTVQVTSEFLESLVGREFSHTERQRFLRALRLLDTNEANYALASRIVIRNGRFSLPVRRADCRRLG